MAELKTKANKLSATDFIAKVKDEQKRKDSQALLKLFKEVTKEKPVMWGTAIIGFGKYHYKSERSSQEGDWPLVGFSPRKDALTIYIMPGFTEYTEPMKKLGKFKTSKGCLYVKKLEDVNTTALKQLIKRAYVDMKKKYPAK